MMEQTRILVVDDDDTFRMLMAGELRQRGFTIATAESMKAALDALAAGDFNVALIDLRLPDGDGLEIVRSAREQGLRTELVILTGHGTIDTAIEAMREGAFDYLRKPCPIEELEVTLNKALEHQALIERNSILSGGLAPPDMGDDFVGASPQFKQICDLINRIAATDSVALILGETGVGKEVVSKLIHARSARSRQPLVVVECANLHGDLLHNELFGHERGAFTGANQPKHGLFEVADKGTLFLDEIGDVSISTQVKLLRVLETGQFRRVGGTKEITVDVRIVAATNRDLKDMIERGYFRKDLYYRLNTIRVEIPPLRERPLDIPVMIEHFLGHLGARLGQRRRFSDRALERLCAHDYPGNVRELLHLVERAVILSDEEVIDTEHLPAELTAARRALTEPLVTLKELEQQHIARVLKAVDGNRLRAAEILGISERTLYRKLVQYDLESEVG